MRISALLGGDFTRFAEVGAAGVAVVRRAVFVDHIPPEDARFVEFVDLFLGCEVDHRVDPLAGCPTTGWALRGFSHIWLIYGAYESALCPG